MNKQKKHKVNLEKLLLNAVPAEPTPEAFYTIDAPESFTFPIQTTFLQNIKIIQQYDPSDVNKYMQQGIPADILKYKDTLCQVKRKSVLIGKNKINIEGIVSFSYNLTYSVAALQNKSLSVYGTDLRLIKQISNFSEKILKQILIIGIPVKTFQGILLLTSSGNDITVKRIQKSMFSTLSCKYSKQIMKSQTPYLQFIELPNSLKKKYFDQDPVFKNSSLVACISASQITLLKINHNKVTGDGFVDIIYNKTHYSRDNICYISWGEAMINSRDSDMKGINLVLTYSFGKQLYLLAPIKNAYHGEQIKYSWTQSFPFRCQNSIIFCQYIKQNEILLITDDKRILIFYTGILEFFEKEIDSKQLDLISYEWRQNFKSKYVSTGTQTQMYSYNNSFAYQFGGNQIYYLTQQKIGIFVYCSWTQICELLVQSSNYESTMNFLIALYNKANRFDLGFKHTPQNFRQLSKYIQKISTEYVHIKFGKYQSQTQQQLLQKFTPYSAIDQILIPIEFLTTTREYTYLFDELKVIMGQYIPESVFFKALQPFISYGRIKYIPDQMLKYTLDYYISRDQSDIVQRLAIHFNLKQIQKGIVIKCCLDNTLIVSLAYICTQGNSSEFVTPFVKFWGIAEDFRKRGEIQFAQYYAMRALWYIKLCLQRSMALKNYSYEKYGQMISILTSNFFTQSMITGLLLIRTQTTLQSLSHYFSIQNASIVNEFCKLRIAPTVNKLLWIDSRQGHQRLQMMLSAIYSYLEIVKNKRQNQDQRIQDQQLFYLFLSKIILFKTVKFIKQKYIEILEFLIRNYTCIKLINYGMQRQQGASQTTQEQDQIKASEYVNKILILCLQQVTFTKPDMNQIFDISRLQNLTQLQAQIKFISGSYGQALTIYLQGSVKVKQNVFPFIQNSFKVLKLQNKKKQKKLLQKQVKDKISQLVQLNPEATTKVVKSYMPQSQDQLIQALSGQEYLQLQYLQQLIATHSPVSQASLLIYIELMSKLKANNLLQMLKKLPNFPVDDSVQICKTYQVYDCLEYLYQRMGNIQESVKMAVVRIGVILKNKHDEDSNSLDPYVKIAQILTNVIQVCIKNKSEQIWEELFDSTIQLYNKYKTSEELSEELDLFYQINAKILYELLNHCSLEHCIYLISEKYGKLDLGGRMNKAFIEVLSNYGFNENIMFSARDLNSRSLADFHDKQMIKNCRGYSIEENCDVCDEPIDKSSKCISFYCGHSYHKQCIVTPKQKDDKLQVKYCIRCLSGQQNQFQFQIFSFQTNNKIRIHKMLQQVLLLRQSSIMKFSKQQQKYNEDQGVKAHNKVVSSKLERMQTYQQQKRLVDQTSIKVRQQLEKSRRRRKA